MTVSTLRSSTMEALRSPWTVTVASFILQIYTVGIVFTFGDLMIHIEDDYDVPESQVSVIGSLQLALLFCTGFFVQPLKRWLSPNTLCMSGLILMALGLISSAYCKVFYALYFTYGILLGSGSGIIWLTALSRVQEVFRGSRPLASGISSSGGGIGVVALSAMRSAMVKTHSWQEALLVELVFVIISIPCVILINRDIPTEDSTLISGYVGDDKVINDTEHTQYERITDDKCHSIDSTDGCVTNNGGEEASHLAKSCGNYMGYDNYEQKDNEDSKISSLAKACGDYSTFDKEHAKYEKEDNKLNSMTPATDEPHKVTGTDEQHASLGELCSHYCSNPLFFLSLLFCGLVVNGMFGPSNLLPSLMIKDRGGSAAESSQLVMIFGIANIVSRFISGITGTYSLRVRCSTLIVVALLGGAMTCAVSLWTSFGLMVFYTATVGSTTGTLVAMMPVLLTDMFGPKHISNLMSYGCATLAALYVAGQPLLGFVADTAGNHQNSFIIMGSLQLAAGVVALIMSVIYIRQCKTPNP